MVFLHRRRSGRTMEELAKQLGITTVYATATYAFFHWLDENASERLQRMDDGSNHGRVRAAAGSDDGALDLNLDTPRSGLALHRGALRSRPTAAAGVSTTAGTNCSSSAFVARSWRACLRQVNPCWGVSPCFGQRPKRPRLGPASPRRSEPCHPWRTNGVAPSP
jgi:hypothetical protein